MKQIAAVLVTSVAAAAMSSCGRQEPASTRPASGPAVSTFVSIAPQATFVERIGGEHVSVEVLVTPAQNPRTFSPSPRQMVRLANADLYFAIGVPFERQLLPRISGMANGPGVVHTSKGLDTRRLEDHRHGEHAGHDHSHDHAHEHGPGHAESDADPHTWLSPRLVKTQAEAICRALSEADPDHAADYAANLTALKADLDALDAELAETLKPLKGRTFYVFHPAFGYFADAYGLRQRAVEVGGKSPGPRQVAELVRQAKADGVRVIFVQPQFSRKSAELIAQQIGGAVVPMDPLARDYFANLRRMAEEVRKALSAPGGGQTEAATASPHCSTVMAWLGRDGGG